MTDGDDTLRDYVIGAVIAHAVREIDLLPGESAEDKRLLTFWNHLFKSDARLREIPHRFPKDTESHFLDLEEFFMKNAAAADFAAFNAAQDVLLARLDAEIAALELPLQENIDRLAKHYALTGADGFRLFDYIRRGPDKFSANPALSIVHDFMSFALFTTAKSGAVNRTEFGFALSHALRENHGWDVLPARASQIFGRYSTPEAKQKINDMIATNKAGEAHKTPVRPIDPRDIKEVNDAAIEFLRATGATGSMVSAILGSPYDPNPRDGSDRGFRRRRFDPK